MSQKKPRIEVNTLGQQLLRGVCDKLLKAYGMTAQPAVNQLLAIVKKTLPDKEPKEKIDTEPPDPNKPTDTDTDELLPPESLEEVEVTSDEDK